jgi:hypothetical protein
MREPYENPTAFPFQPLTLQGEPTFPEYGMTLRDWFAGQALAGMSANAEYLDLLPKTGNSSEKALSEVCFNIADAMLAARQGGDA